MLCFFPGPTYRPDVINFRGRFEMLSDRFAGEVYSHSCNDKFQELPMGNFKYRGCIVDDKRRFSNLRAKCKMLRHFLKNAKNYYRNNGVDVIICYDPIFTGVLGAYLKQKFNCKLIIELNNSSMEKAMTMEGSQGFKTKVKILISKFLRSYALKRADGIKILAEKQRESLQEPFLQKRIYCFHSFVPDTVFSQSPKRLDPVILCVGHPFYRKGVDILTKAFEKIVDEVPDFELHCIGYLLEDEARKRLGSWHERIKFFKPVFHEELRPHFLNCYCFVLPSREEGMGRVILEAMASGKAIIGSDVGGIPKLVKHNDNGFLFESENVDDLAGCLKKILQNPQLAKRMGERSTAIIKEKYSCEKYIHHLSKMIEEVVSN